MKVSVSYLGQKDRIETIKKINQTDADLLHVDITDGKFADTKNDNIALINKEVSNSKKPLDVHLMVNKPDKLINNFALMNVEYLTIHAEIKNVDKCLDKIKETGIKRGLSIKLETDVEVVDNYLEKVDLILLMAVKVGYSGQEFSEAILEKVRYIKAKNKNIKIAVDGGLNYDIAYKLKELGVEQLVSGSYITCGDDYQIQIDKLRG